MGETDIDGCTLFTFNGGGKLKPIIIDIVRDGTWEQPEPGIKRPSPGNTKKFKATIIPDTTKAKIKFELVGTSRQPGINMNTGRTDDLAFDLKFENQKTGFANPTDENQKIMEDIANANDNTATVTVTATDYGAFGKIKAVAVIDGTEITSTINILEDNQPKGGNNIEDAWDVAFPAPMTGTRAADDDHDNAPVGDGEDGDLLTRYEEYRGFTVKDNMSNNVYRTSNPAVKTIFLRDMTGHTTTDGRGGTLSLAERMGAEVFYVGEGQTGENRRINPNGGMRVQRAIWVENSEETQGDLGFTRGPGAGIRPSNYRWCRVWIARHSESYPLNFDLPNNGQQLPGLVYSELPGTRTLPGTHNRAWRDNGRVKIGNEILGYQTGVAANTVFTTRTAEVAIPANSTAIILAGIMINEFICVRIGNEVIRAQQRDTLGLITHVQQVNPGDNIIRTTGVLIAPNPGGGGAYYYAKLGDGINTEWISYTGAGQQGNDSVLTGVQRGLLGTQAIQHAAKTSLNIPRQLGNVLRGQVGTQAAIIAIGTPVTPVGVLETVIRGQAGTIPQMHRDGAAVARFSNVDQAIRMTAAHEVGRVVDLRVAPNFHIMVDQVSRGPFLTNGLFDDFTETELRAFNAR